MLSRELESRIPFLGPAFTEAGLRDDEVKTLLRLCASMKGYSKYRELLRANRRLARIHADRVDLVPLGYSTDHPADSESPRPIEATVASRSARKRIMGAVACLEARQHATEATATQTATAVQQFDLAHPNFLERQGFSHLVTSNVADPDGQEIQTWTDYLNPNVGHLVFGGVRGDQKAQLAWSYPTATSEGSSETHASLAMLNMFNPVFLGSVHNSMFKSFFVVSSNFPDLLPDVPNGMVRIYERMGLPVNTGIHGSEMFKSLAPGFVAIDALESGKLVLPGSVADHLPEGAVFFNPEVPMFRLSNHDPGPSGKTFGEALVRGGRLAQRITRVAMGVFEKLDRDALRQRGPVAGRLIDMAEFWHATVYGEADDAESLLTNLPPEVANKQLSVTEYRVQSIPIAINSLMVAANVRRLALIAQQPAEAAALRKYISHTLRREVGKTQAIPLDVQVCTQALATLAGLRRVARASGMCDA